MSTRTFEPTTSTETQALTWTSISAAVAIAATVPMVWILANPLSRVLFVRGHEHHGDWSYVFLVALVMTAPATYALFFGTAGELLKPRVSARVHRSTMRIAAAGLLPYIAMATAAVYWNSGPQYPLLITAALTIPIAMVVTIWSSAQNH